jgi:hypothetical protein
MTKLTTKRSGNSHRSCKKISTMKQKVKRKRLRTKKRASLAALRKLRELLKAGSDDDCDFDFDSGGRALCSSSSDDSDLPEGEN